MPGNGSGNGGKRTSALSRRLAHYGYVLVDILLICMNGVLAFYGRFATVPLWNVLRHTSPKLESDLPIKQHIAFLLLYAILIVLFCQSHDLYRTPRGRSMRQESWAVIRAVLFATLVLTAFIFSSNVKMISRAVLGINVALNLTTLVAWRAWKRQLVARRVAQGVGSLNALIVGSGSLGQQLAAYLEENKQFGFRVIGFLDEDHRGDPRVLGTIEDLPRVARAQFVDEVFVTTLSERDLVKRVAAEARRQHLNVKVVPDLYDELGLDTPIRSLGELPLVELHWEAIPTLGLFVKRVADVVLSALALIISAPILLVAAIGIKIDSRGPVFYKSERVGRKGVVFTCWKLRTMVANADQLKKNLNHLNERSNGLLFKVADDPRVTRIGMFLRRYSIDELPQLWNVLRGEMSLVGPRPPLPSEFDQYSLEHLRRLDVKPGITGLWQVTARQDPSFENYMALDLEYIEHWGFWMDAKILWKTIPAVLRGRGQ